MALTKQQRIVTLGAWLGWSLDGYDLVLMLFVIPVISHLFFPSTNEVYSLLATFAAYVVTLVMRPFGGAFFGNFGDRIGRKKVMMVTILGFSIGTFATGFLPTWQMVGIMAPILLIVLRFMQGFFAGGEWGSGAVLTMETVHKRSRGLFSGFLQSGFPFGFIIASLVFYFVTSSLSESEFAEYGWRILFFTGIIPGSVALFVRLKMEQSKVWLEKSIQKKIAKFPLSQIWKIKEQRKRFVFALVIMTGLMYTYYTSLGFFPTLLQDFVGIEKVDSSKLMILATATSFLGTIFVGYLSQITGRQKAMALFAASAAIISIPSIYGLYHSTFFYEQSFYIIVIVFVATTGFGAIPAFLSERFPTEIRNSASGFAYNGGLFFGAIAPIVALNLVSKSGEFAPFLLGFNIILGSVIILIGTKINPETKDVDIEE
ncbi:MAG: MFS transporter [Nitrosopumilaceae archaeon]|jgi:MFS family permease